MKKILVSDNNGADTSYSEDLFVQEIGIEKAADNTPTIVVKTGLSVDIDAGYLGIVVLDETAPMRSIMLSNPFIVSSTDNLMLKFKLHTNALPYLYSKDEKIGSIQFIKLANVINHIEISPVEESVNEQQIETIPAEEAAIEQ